MRKLTSLVLIGTIAAAIYLVARRASAEAAALAPLPAGAGPIDIQPLPISIDVPQVPALPLSWWDSAGMAIGDLVQNVKTLFTGSWQLPAAGEPYRALFDQATARYGLPPNLLARVAYQESHFRPDIINGQLASSAGALGIMQLVPRWHPDVNPLDPAQAIPYAAKYLRQLHDQFGGSWREALAAYNAGPGTLSQALADGTALPLETRLYVSSIANDVGLVA